MVVCLLSRNQVYEAEWRLNPHVFHMIMKKWGQPRADLIANQENTQVCLLFPQQKPLGVDALAHSWKFHLCYTFPPFSAYPSGHNTNPEWGYNHNPHHSLLAQEGLVFIPFTDAPRTVLAPSVEKRPADIRSPALPGCSKAKTAWLLKSSFWGDRLVANLLSEKPYLAESVTRAIYSSLESFFQLLVHRSLK